MGLDASEVADETGDRGTLERWVYLEPREVEVDDRSEQRQQLRQAAEAANSDRIQRQQSAAVFSELRPGPWSLGV